jgi:rhamnulokinase
MADYHYLACDLGAESGRVLLGSFENGRITLREIHRFANGPVHIGGTLRWDFLRIFEELKLGLKKAADCKVPVSSVSCDSWGVDYALLSGGEPLLALPFHYRDARTDGAMERAFAVVPADEIFAETGIQFMPLNTLYQLYIDLQTRPGILDLATQFLNVGDYFNFLLSGCAAAEESLASTTQLYNPRARAWSAMLMERFGFPARIFPRIVPSGTPLGPMADPVAEETGLAGAQVIAGCSHDTAAAVAAVPAEGAEWAYISSGTWSLLGIENATAMIGPRSRQYNFTNEVGFGGSIRFLKNIVGLWLIQECRREWAIRGQECGYEELARMAGEAEPLKTFIDPMEQSFLKPGGMPEKIAGFCRASGQAVPATPGAIVRTALESLALLYRRTLDQLEDASGRSLTTLHIVGGGSRNHLLNQCTANATRRAVLAGPAECTGLGNILVQAMALGHIPSITAARAVVRESFPLSRYQPADGRQWEEAYHRYLKLAG